MVNIVGCSELGSAASIEDVLSGNFEVETPEEGAPSTECESTKFEDFTSRQMQNMFSGVNNTR